MEKQPENINKEVKSKDCAAEDRYRTLFDQSPDGIVVIGMNGNFIEFNQATHVMLGYTREEFMKLRISDIAVDSADKIQACITRLLNDGKAEFETKYIGKDGKTRDIQVISRVMHFAGERVFHSIWRDVTEHNRTQVLLEKQQIHLEEAQKIAHLGSWEWNLVDGTAAWSAEMFNIFGFIPQEIDVTYERFLSFVHPEDRRTVETVVERALHDKKSYSLDLRITRKDEAARIMSVTGEVVSDESGRPVLMRGIGQDITERRRVEDSLRESEKQFKLIAETISEVFWMADVTISKMFYISPGYEKIWGRSRQSLYENPKSFMDAIHPDDRERVLGGLANQKKGLPFDHEYRIIQPGGAIRWIWDRGYPARNENGRINIYVGVAQDITDRRHIETLSKEKDELINNILDSVGEGFIVVDRQYKILLANKAYCKQVNVVSEDVAGSFCYKATHRASRPCFENGESCIVKMTFDTGEPHSGKHRHYDYQGNPYYVDIKVYPLKVNANGEVMSVIQTITDISENKKLEDQLQHAQKMEAIGLLAGGVAHDFNNMLTATRGFGDLAKMKLPDGHPAKAYVEEIIKSSSRAAELTRSLLAFSRKQSINLRPVNINQTISNVGNLLSRIIGEDIQLKLEILSQDLIVVADPGQMEQILMNLATNARDAMQAGGILTVKTEFYDIDQDFIKRHGFGSQGKYALICVSDTGIGMDTVTQSRIFEPYFTTKDIGKGTGLGLSMVYGIVKQHEGYITVDSEMSIGTTFKIYLPRVHSFAHQETIPKHGCQPIGNETILLAEDDDAVRNLVATMLTECGYSVISSSDGVQAIQKFLDNRNQVQLLLFDMIMPEKNGLQAYEEIRKIQPAIKALFMSGYHGEILKSRNIEDRPVNIITKPVSQSDLLTRIREALNG